MSVVNIKDEDHEAFGAMIHRGKVEEATKTRNYHRDQKEALDFAITTLESISAGESPGSASEEAYAALKHIKRLLK